VQLLAYHLWLTAGTRGLLEVLPGVLLSIVLWLLAARLFASWLAISDYSRFYAGLTRIMSALVFFQVSSLIVILGAEFNRGIVQMKRVLAASGDLEGDVSTVPLPPSRESYRLDA
jgi:membrane protein